MKRIFVLALVSLLPIALTSFIWLEVFRGVASRAIDGSGHYGIAQIYDQTIFPDVFGWTPAYFAGMPFPNFYPPLFFWLVSLIHHTHLLSFPAAFKVVVTIPLLLMPAAFWAIAWVHAGKDQYVALGTSIAAATLYTMGEVFQPNTGLDMSSTLLDGFYTQPLGFILLLSWILVYLLPRQKKWQFAAAAILLALTVLANFFNAITAALLIISVLSRDVVMWLRAPKEDRQSIRITFLQHLVSPAIALGLTAFWLVPVVSTYQYLVTRPIIRPLSDLMTTPIWCWYILAILGVSIWWRHPAGRIGSYLVGCLLLFLGIFVSGTFAPTWFPLQVFRFFSTINFLLCIPVGISVAFLARLYFGKKTTNSADTIGKSTNQSSTFRRQAIIAVISLLALCVLAISMSTKKLNRAFAFYTSESFGRISGALEFARTHKDGRYLVEVLPSVSKSGLVRADSLALNAYLGAQGNETISIVYREASPNSSFFNAELNAFSSYRENFGISSTLIDDLDFIDQPLEQHIKRLQFIGVRYLIIATEEMKGRLSREPSVGERHEIGRWTIFELRPPALPKIRPIQFRPALVVSDFSVKLKRSNQWDFIRLAEEQFSDGWFDVLLVHAPEQKIDQLANLDKFGALIIDRYDFDDDDRALALLRGFAETRPLILLSSNAPLFARIRSSLNSFAHAVVIERPNEPPGEPVTEAEPSHHYNSSAIRATWKSIRVTLDKEKIPVARTVIGAESGRGTIGLIPLQMNQETDVPVLISQTYNPRWIRDDGKSVYAVTPFFTLTFIDQSTRITFQRGPHDWIAFCISLVLFLTLCFRALFAVIQKVKSTHLIRSYVNGQR